MQAAGLQHLRVFPVDGRRRDHNVRPGHILAMVAGGYGTAKLREPLGDGRRAQVGTGNGIAEIEQEFSNAAHANAADTDKMDMFMFFIHRSPARYLLFAASRQISTIFSAASGMPSARILRDIPVSLSRYPAKVAIACASTWLVISFSSYMMAPPPCT